MKKLLMAILMLSSFMSFAQSEYNGGGMYYYDFNYLIGSIPAPKNETVEIKTTNIKNGKVKVYQKSYNEQANLIKSMKIEEGKSILVQDNLYNKEGKVLERNIYSKGKLRTEYKYERDEASRTTVFTRKKKGKIKAYNTYNYQTPKGMCYSKSIAYKKGGEKIFRVWDYEYYDNACDKKQSTLRNGKGKVLKTWTYDCKQEGEELTKKKDVNQICKWEESDDKYLKKVYQSFDEKGKTYTNVQLYRKSDTALVSSTSNYTDGRKYESTYNPDIKKILTSHNINKKGVITYGRTYTYEGERLLSSTFIRKGKVKSKNEYIYNSDETLVAYKYYGKDGELIKSSVLAYK